MYWRTRRPHRRGQRCTAQNRLEPIAAPHVLTPVPSRVATDAPLIVPVMVVGVVVVAERVLTPRGGCCTHCAEAFERLRLMRSPCSSKRGQQGNEGHAVLGARAARDQSASGFRFTGVVRIPGCQILPPMTLKASDILTMSRLFWVIQPTQPLRCAARTRPMQRGCVGCA